MDLNLGTDAAVESARQQSPFVGRPPACVAYGTQWGRMLRGQSDEILEDGTLTRYEGKVNLIFTSPPFPLNRKKRYGNETGQSYIDWLTKFGPLFKKMLTPDGAIVIEMGNSWEPGVPVMSTLALRALHQLQQENGLNLCQEFIWQNPARLPSPAQWSAPADAPRGTASRFRKWCRADQGDSSQARTVDT